jgi:hypothetical protein
MRLRFGLFIVDHHMPPGCGKAARYRRANAFCPAGDKNCAIVHRISDKVN